MKIKSFGKTEPQLPAVPPAASAEEVHDAAIASALAGTRKLRDELAHYRAESERLRVDLAVTHQECDSLHARLTDTTAKMEFYQRWSIELVTQCNDLEMIVRGSMSNVNEVLNGSLATVAKSMNEGMRHLGKYLDDIHEKAKHREYRPNGAAPLEQLADRSDGEEQERLEQLASKLAPDVQETVQ